MAKRYLKSINKKEIFIYQTGLHQELCNFPLVKCEDLKKKKKKDVEEKKFFPSN